VNLSHALTILIKGKNLSAPALKDAGAGVTELATKVTMLGQASAAIGPIIGLVGAAIGKVFTTLLAGAVLLIGGIVSLTAAFVTSGFAATKYARQLESTSAAFRGIARDDAPALLEAMQKNSRHMMDDLRLQEQYVSAYMLTGKVLADRLPEAYLYLSKVALATHDDLDFLTERLYRSVGRLSTRWMAYIGTVVELEEATAHAVNMTGKMADALTREEIQAAMLDRVLQKLAVRTATLPEILGSTEQMTMHLKTAFKNLWGEFGTHFLPIVRSGVSTILKFIAALDALISKGGGMYTFLRTLAATAAVVLDVIGGLADKFLANQDVISAKLESFTQRVLQIAWNAFSWGVTMISNLARGMIEGAATALIAAINFITSLLTFWFRPGSPPRVAPDIDKWGAETMNIWLEGFTHASFDILEGVQSKLESVLSAMVSVEMLSKVEAARLFLDISADMIQALSDLQNTGKITEQLYARIIRIGGGFGQHLAELINRQLAYAKAVERVELATRNLEWAERELTESQTALSRVSSEYFTMLIRKASYQDLIAKRTEREAAIIRNRRAEAGLTAAEAEEKAAQEAEEGLQSRLRLQNRLIDQLTLLLRKQAELAEAESEKGGGGGAKAGGGAGAGLELPELDVPGSLGASVDQAFEDLKDRIRKKFKELWDEIKKDWAESDVGELFGELQTALEELKTFLDQNAPAIKERLNELAEPVVTWLKEDIWGEVTTSIDSWGEWWTREGPSVSAAMLKVQDAMIELWEAAEEGPPRDENVGTVGWFKWQGTRTQYWASEMLHGAVNAIKTIPVAISEAVSTIILGDEGLFGGSGQNAIDIIVALILGEEGDLDTALEERMNQSKERFNTVVEGFFTVLDDLTGGSITNFVNELGRLGGIIVTWFEEDVDRPASEVNTAWSNTYFPGMTLAVQTNWDLMKVNFDLIKNYLTGEDGLKADAEAVALSWSVFSWPIISGAVEIAWKIILGIFELLDTWLGIDIPAALGLTETAFSDKMGKITKHISPVQTMIDNLFTGIKNFWNWLETHIFKFDFSWPEIPEWAQTRSPMKIHTAWMNFYRDLETHTARPRMDFSGMGGTGEAFGVGGTSTRIYIERLVIQDASDVPDLLRQIQEAA